MSASPFSQRNCPPQTSAPLQNPHLLVVVGPGMVDSLSDEPLRWANQPPLLSSGVLHRCCSSMNQTGALRVSVWCLGAKHALVQNVHQCPCPPASFHQSRDRKLFLTSYFHGDWKWFKRRAYHFEQTVMKRNLRMNGSELNEFQVVDPSETVQVSSGSLEKKKLLNISMLFSVPLHRLLNG